MKRYAGRAGSDRRDGNRVPAIPRSGGIPAAAQAIVALLLLVFTVPAFAGDRALIDYIGFSPDNRYFAFEEFGIQDGSGFAYSSIYVIDLSSDSWVVGTPVRVQAENETRTLADVRREVAERAAGHIQGFEIEVPVEVAALIGDGVPDNDGKALNFGAPGYGPGAVSGAYALALSSFTTSSASPCGEWFGTEPLGYELSIRDSGAERLVHRDGVLPRSRGCPLEYRLYGVVMPFMNPSLSNAVAIVSVYPGGFEGPDRRFLAVPLGL